MPNPLPPEPEGYTRDGYIRNQDCFSAYTYRTMPACINCCGPVAAFNLRHFRKQQVAFSEVLREMDGMHLLHAPGPTRMYVMCRYLRKYLPGWREARGREASLAAARESAMGIFRYHEQNVPHFVAFLRAEHGLFRFFNVGDGLTDGRIPMERFAAEHCAAGPVRLLYWK